jgi:uncharacterized integral membrane protein
LAQHNDMYGKVKAKWPADKGRLKLIAILVLLLVIIVVGFQNREDITTRILFFTITMPGFVLLMITALFGFIIGVLFSLHFLGRANGERQVKKELRE